MLTGRSKGVVQGKLLPWLPEGVPVVGVRHLAQARQPLGGLIGSRGGAGEHDADGAHRIRMVWAPGQYSPCSPINSQRGPPACPSPAPHDITGRDITWVRGTARGAQALPGLGDVAQDLALTGTQPELRQHSMERPRECEVLVGGRKGEEQLRRHCLGRQPVLCIIV